MEECCITANFSLHWTLGFLEGEPLIDYCFCPHDIRRSRYHNAAGRCCTCNKYRPCQVNLWREYTIDLFGHNYFLRTMLNRSLSILSFYLRFEEATHRTTRWLDRCIKAHTRPHDQSLFPIVQGGFDLRLRDISIRVRKFSPARRVLELCLAVMNITMGAMRASLLMVTSLLQVRIFSPKRRALEYVSQDLVARNMPGYAIGGLAGGEAKEMFWPVVSKCAAGNCCH